MPTLPMSTVLRKSQIILDGVLGTMPLWLGTTMPDGSGYDAWKRLKRI